MDIDVRDVLPAIRVPTLVIHRSGDRVIPVESGRYLAEHISDAKFVEVPGHDHFPFVGDIDAIVDEIEEFLTGSRRAREPDRVLATVLFTDIVGSTRTCRRARRPALDRASRRASPDRASRAREVSGQGGTDRRRRVPRDVRRPGEGDSVRRGDPGRAFALSGSRSAPGSTRVRSSSRRPESRASQSTSARASPRSHRRATCSPRALSRIWSSAPGSTSPTAAATPSRVSRASGGSTRSTAPAQPAEGRHMPQRCGPSGRSVSVRTSKPRRR